MGNLKRCKITILSRLIQPKTFTIISRSLDIVEKLTYFGSFATYDSFVDQEISARIGKAVGDMNSLPISLSLRKAISWKTKMKSLLRYLSQFSYLS